jgi:hypothetical protein
MDYLASLYIDNELNLPEKSRFIEKIRSEDAFFDETMDLLAQEEMLRIQPESPALPEKLQTGSEFKTWIKKMWRPVVYAGAGFTAAGLLLFSRMTLPSHQVCANRFVIYEPTASQVELAGTFTDWQRKPMKQLGSSGYWELRLQIPSGEHRFTYILDGARKVADPTLPVREKDDFGGENSILQVEVEV